MDVVYPYKKNYSNELEWSIKSLKNIKYKNIYVVGDNPDFNLKATLVKPTKRAWHIFSPFHDQIDKYLTACETSKSDYLLLLNDDMFILDKTQIKNYNRGSITQHLNERNIDSYSSGLRSTMEYLKSKGYTEVDFELHIPMLVERLKLKQAIEELIPILSTSKKIMIRSYYGNRFNIESEYMEDIKNKIATPYMSTNEDTFLGDLGEHIRNRLC